MSKSGLKPLIIPIFIPNQGCPHRCVFCEQEKITSQTGLRITSSHVKNILDKAVRSKNFDPGRRPEVAFYGGTFTGLSRNRMRALLEAVTPYIKNGLFRSIRVSTRPDALDDDRLEIMKAYGVVTVELGVQSMNDEVLELAQRGHSAGDTVRAFQVLKKTGFKVGVQLLPGLPGDSEKRFRATIARVLTLDPDMVRLYPVLVLRGTVLARLYEEGKYRPMKLDGAIETCIESCIRLETAGIPVIRLGLMSSSSLLEEGQILAGPWHPAFGFLVRSGIHLRGIDLPKPKGASMINIFAPQREIPLVRGYKNEGLKWIEKRTGAEVVGVKADDSVSPGKIRIEEV